MPFTNYMKKIKDVAHENSDIVYDLLPLPSAADVIEFRRRSRR